jgi:hypothetical protein
MPTTLNIPDRSNAQTKTVTLKVSTGKNEGRSEISFEAELPATLGDAIALYGERAVFRKFINGQAVYLQSAKRTELQKPADTPEPTIRKRAQYLEQLGL